MSAPSAENNTENRAPAKKLIDDPAHVVDDMIHGLVGRTRGLARVADWPVIVRARDDGDGDRGSGGGDGGGGGDAGDGIAGAGGASRASRVRLISGGGSGHEPAHAGYVGPGMLDAAVLGPVFTSPSADAVHAAIVAAADSSASSGARPDDAREREQGGADAAGSSGDESPSGGSETLLIVKNYTGDRLNFGLAAQMAQAEGHVVDMVIVADDVALGDVSRAGRRGIGGTVLVHKVAGALATGGASLAEVKAGVERFTEGLGTMGVALGPCHSPGASEPNFELGDDEIEWGLGIHGESGHERGSVVGASEVASRLVDTVCEDRGIGEGERVVVLVNGLGATPPMELEILTGRVLDRLRELGVQVQRCWTGTFLTSLDMPGVSVSVARVDDDTLALLDAPADTLAWVPGRRPAEGEGAAVQVDLHDPLGELGEGGGGSESRGVDQAVTDAVERAARALLEARDDLTELDQKVGDGDLGVNLARAAQAVLDHTEALGSAPDVRTYFRAVSQLIRSETGGSSGALYSLLILGFADAFDEGVTSVDVAAAAPAFAAGVASVRELGGADVGDATMIDALVPASEALTQAAEGGSDAAEAAEAVVSAAKEGAESTRDLIASLGRASYVGERGKGIPDPGAVAVTLWLEAALTP